MNFKTKTALFFICSTLCLFSTGALAMKFNTDTLRSSAGPIQITCIGHGTLMLTVGDKIIHIDPVSQCADYSLLPKADIILITHEHEDHLDAKAIAAIRKSSTKIITSKVGVEALGEGTRLNNGDTMTVDGIGITAVPAYNIVHLYKAKVPYHPKGRGNGYVLLIGGKKFYIAGDTENIPETASLTNIDVAFLPMNLPYTMTPAMCADAALRVKPTILYPYHLGETNVEELVKLLTGHPEIEVRIRKMQ
jgi:L-ascorbate metabolism protein UlaG (beta-lactamase superfamily)